MIKMISAFCFFLAAMTPSFSATNERGSIGSTFSSPVLFENNLSFVATTGVLYKSNLDLSHPIKLFEGKKQTLGAATLVGSILYWGEGLHQDKLSTFYAFDLKAKKMLKEISVNGHIEREAFHHDGVIFVGLGPGGMAAFKAHSLEKIWQTNTVDNKLIHADGNIVFTENKVCTTSIYDYQGIICLDSKTGKVLNAFKLKKNPKSEITLTHSLIVGFATEATMNEPNWKVPADFYVIDLKTNKITIEKELRGFNFFAPLIFSDFAFVTLSTGDFITISLKNGSIGFLGEFPEPFINNPFMIKESFCGLGIMGKILCFSKSKNGHGITNDKRLLETPIGKITNLAGKTYAPSRVGYFIIE